jgi:glycosyltransferase involved in cell wall biosynthesis
LKKITQILLCLWWGGFTFYAGVVVPVGMRALGSHFLMGKITQEVTNYINFLSLGLFIWLAYFLKKSPDSSSILVKEILAFTLIGSQLLLFLLHKNMSEIIDNQSLSAIFYLYHRIYLIVSTCIWLMVSYFILDLR